MTDLTKAKEQFDKALKKALGKRFYDPESKRIIVKPEVVEICDSKNCDAGDNCVHEFKVKGITFCVY